MTTTGPGGKFLHQLQWRAAVLGPTEMLSIQMVALQIALKAAIAEVDESIQRVEGMGLTPFGGHRVRRLVPSE